MDDQNNRHNPYIVALSIGFGLTTLVAPRWIQAMAHSLRPLLESGILLTSVAAVELNLCTSNKAKGDTFAAVDAAKVAKAQ